MTASAGRLAEPDPGTGGSLSARSRGIDVPGRVSVAGIDDTRPARLVDLTSVSLPLHEMGTRAARVVVDGGGDDMVLAHRLVPRTTTAPRRP